MSDRRIPATLPRVCVAAGLALVLGACQSHYGHHVRGQYAQGRNVHDSTRADAYLDRRDTITAHAGDSQATNRVLMARDPWPEGAWNRNIPHDGQRMNNTIERYRTPRTPTDSTQGQNQGLVSGPTTNDI